MQTLFHDLSYGARMLLRNPGFTAVAGITLALGIGANSAVFSVANALLLKPLPFENLDKLVAIRETLPDQGLKATAVSPADFFDWRSENTVFREVAAYRIKDARITGTGDPELARGCFVSADFFSALEVHTVKGRTLLPDEDQPGSDQVVVLGYGLWQRRFAGEPSVLGASITLNGRACTVVGIMPPNFDFPFGAELWMPLALTPQQMSQRDTRYLHVLGRLKPGFSVAQAQAEMLAVAERIERQYPQTNTGLRVQVIPLRHSDFTRPLITVLIAMAGFILLLACANVANLLFARSTTRQKELAIRAALGASRWRVSRLLITEGLLLSCVAGTMGVLMAKWAADLIKASLPPDIARFMPGWREISVDGRVLVFTFGVVFLATLVFSLAPALRASQPDLNESLKEGGKSSGGSSSGRRARSFLVAVEIALALVLLVGAGLTVKGFWRILNTFDRADPAAILTMRTPLQEPEYKDPQRVAEFYQQVISRMETIPQVESVCAASNTPLNNRPNPSIELEIDGRPPLSPGERQSADLLVISPNYFKMIGASLVKGRDFVESDGRAAPPVAIISDLAARRYWPDEEVLGRRIKRRGSGAAANSPWLTIVGVVPDVKQAWFDKEVRPQLYLPYLQAPQPTMSFLLRTSSDPMSLVPAARSHVLAVDGDQPIEHIKTLARLFVDETSPFRFAAVLMLVFGATALVLSAVGVYGVMSYSSARRAHEIGLRMALGARRRDVLRLIVGHGLKTAMMGLAVGLPLALALSRVMASMLFGVVALEYPTLMGFVGLMAVVALLSSYIPARRAARVDPMIALRSE